MNRSPLEPPNLTSKALGSDLSVSARFLLTPFPFESFPPPFPISKTLLQSEVRLFLAPLFLVIVGAYVSFAVSQ